MSSLRNANRDKEIAHRYEAGENQRTLSREFRVTRGRIQQILKSEGVKTRPKANTKKYAMVAANVTKDTKAALKDKAKEKKTSISSLVNELIEEDLKK